MPNECRNHLTIVGHKEDLRIIADNKLKFSYFHYPPDNMTEEEEYYWRCNNWGTKWEAYNMEIIEEAANIDENDPNENLFECTFTTAWSPPIPFLEHLMTLFPRCWMKLTFKTEDNVAGVFVQYHKNRDPKHPVTTYSKWYEPEPRLTTKGEIYIEGDD